MAYQFKLPEMGEGLTEGDVADFEVKVGDTIKADDPLVEIQTDKSTTELVSPVDGKVTKIAAKADDHVEKGDLLVEIDDGKDAVSTNVEDAGDDEDADEDENEAPAEDNTPAPAAPAAEEAPTAVQQDEPVGEAAPDAEKKDTVIIGGGPGGYVAAIRASEYGQKVTLIEEGDGAVGHTGLGGVCLNVGCVPSKALIAAGHAYQAALDSSTYGVSKTNATLDFKKTQNWKDTKVVARMTRGVKMLLKKHKVEIISGHAVMDNDRQLRVIKPGPKQFMDNDNGRKITWNNLILATGSRPIEIPNFKFEGRVIDSTGGLELTEVPKNFVVIGGGYVGCELAGAYADMGAKVTIIEGLPSILNGFDKDMVKVVQKNMKKKGITVITNAMAKNSEQDDNSVTVTYSVDGKDSTIKADYCMVTVGRKPNTDNFSLDMTSVKLDDHNKVIVDAQGRTNVKGIWAIGDMVPGAALAHKAFFEAKTAAGAISGKKTANDWVGVPAVCFTDPEMAEVGMTQADAKDKGIEVATSQFPFAGNARAVSLDQPEGFVRFVYTKDEKNIVGAQVVGPEASTLASELSLIVNCGMNVEDVALTIHPHPTLGEPIQEAADVAMGLPTHI